MPFPASGNISVDVLLPQTLHLCKHLLYIKRGCLFIACYYNVLQLLKDVPNHMDHGVNKIN